MIWNLFWSSTRFVPLPFIAILFSLLSPSNDRPAYILRQTLGDLLTEPASEKEGRQTIYATALSQFDQHILHGVPFAMNLHPHPAIPSSPFDTSMLEPAQKPLPNTSCICVSTGAAVDELLADSRTWDRTIC
jgi:hypothetical protein